MGKGSPAQPHFPRIFAFYDTSSAGSLQGGKNECRFAEVSNRKPPFPSIRMSASVTVPADTLLTMATRLPFPRVTHGW